MAASSVSLNKTLKVTIVGDAKSGTKATTDFSKSVNSMNANLSKANKSAGSSAQGIASKLTSATSGIVSFATSSIDQFDNVAKGTITLKKYLGGTSEDASRLAFVAKESGVGVDQLGKGLGILNKHLVANDGPWKSLGINAKDAQGHLKPMSELLPQISDKFAKLPAGPQKTALAMNLFGKAGVGLLPVLNKGSAGIKELTKESDALGYTMGDKTVNATIAQAKAQRTLHAEQEAIKVQIGGALIPILGSLTSILAKTLLPVIKKASDFFRDHKTTVTVLVGALTAFLALSKLVSLGTKAYGAAVKIAGAATKIWSGIQAAFNLIMDANPIALVVLALVALVAGIIYAYTKFKWFRDFIQTVWKDIQAIVQWAIGAVWQVIKFHIDLILLQWHAFWYIFQLAIVDPIKWIYNHIDDFVNFFAQLPGKIGRFFVGMWDGLEDGFKDAINGIIDAWNWVASGLTFKVPGWVPGLGGDKFGLPHIPHLAKGGDIKDAGSVLVGENGPEVLSGLQGARVTPLSKVAKAGGGGVVVQVNVQGSVTSEKNLHETIYRELLKRSNRNGGKLGLA